ncbi:MAG: sulfite exporter TauE/SafE family protein [Candidatus Methanoplasma sp.]|jgi:uncharacterized membrane protein YfcA|nr:sulfite exporter TauE/SafE family protein [Candidatus Methanoplasma sp.]
MDPILIIGLLVIGIGAGTLGALFGIGGGIIFVPVLTVLYGLTASEAVAVSLIGIIAASTGAASQYVGTGMSNVRLGLLLETTTTIGAMIGAVAAAYVENWLLLLIFAVVLLYSGISMIAVPERPADQSTGDDICTFRYNDPRDGKEKRYRIGNLISGTAVCTAAGAMSSMTGVGGGTIKVPLMNLHMHVPIKVASATSNYMIGITAFSGAIIYFMHGDILLDYAAAIAIGAFVGSIVGARISKYMNASAVKKYFSILLFIMSAVIMLEAGGYI